jgi:hypothetical protein
MRPRREEPKAPKPRPEEKQKRFHLLRLEERIAPKGGGNGTNNCNANYSHGGGAECFGSYSIA